MKAYSFKSRMVYALLILAQVVLTPLRSEQLPVLTVAGGMWNLSCNITNIGGSGWLQTSDHTGGFTNQVLLTNGANAISGTASNRTLFFRYSSMPLLPTNASYSQEGSYLYNGLILGRTYTVILGTNDASAIMNPKGVGSDPVTLTNGVPFVCTHNPIQLNGVSPSQPVTAVLCLTP